jgi:hypothetical protein
LNVEVVARVATSLANGPNLERPRDYLRAN